MTLSPKFWRKVRKQLQRPIGRPRKHSFVSKQFGECASDLEPVPLMIMAPIQEDFILTISDNEDIGLSLESEEASARPAPSTKGSNKKRKREDPGDGNHINGTKQPSKKQKKAKRKSKSESDSNASEKEEEQSWAARGKDDGAMDSDFEFQVQGPDSGVFEDFDGWDVDLEKSNVGKQGNKKGVDIDALIAKRREGKGSKGKTNGLPETNGDDEDMDDESEVLDIGADDADSLSQEQDDEGEDETLAADGFGMGATGLDEESDVVSQDNEDHESEHTSDNDSVAEPVAHPDDEASNAPTDDEQDDPAELARQKAFFAPEEDVKKSTSIETSSKGFQNMSLSRPILRGLASLGFSTPTPIQSKTIPIALLGKDVVGGAVTGSGKTAAFIVPILERLLYRPKKIPTSRVAILMPTRELAVQCFNVAQKLASFTDITFSLLSGGFSLRAQETHLRTRPDILIATAGRFIDHMRNSPSFTVSTLEILVLDEADRMLDDGFSKELDEILTTIPKRRQTLLFSATMTSRVDKLIRLGLQRPVRILINPTPQTVTTLTQEFVRLRQGREDRRLACLLHLCTTVFTTRTIIFFRQKKLAHRIRVLFALCDISASELHGDMSQEQRLNALTSFKTGSVSHLLATDVASRGLDIKGVDTVFNYSAPQSLHIYLHRVGRTARAGAVGRAITLAAEEDRKVVKQAVKSAKAQGAKVVSRALENETVDAWHARIAGMEEEVDAVLKEEKEEKVLAEAERDVRKGENMVVHEGEIGRRERRTWFENDREKAEGRRRGAVELNGVQGGGSGGSGKKREGKLSGKERKKLDLGRERREGRVWKKGKEVEAKGRDRGGKSKNKTSKQQKAIAGKGKKP